MAMVTTTELHNGSANTKSKASTDTSYGAVASKEMRDNQKHINYNLRNVKPQTDPPAGDGDGGGNYVAPQIQTPDYSGLANDLYSKLLAKIESNRQAQLDANKRNGQLAQNNINSMWNRYKNNWRKEYNPAKNRGNGISTYLSGASDFADMSAENNRATDDNAITINSKFDDSALDMYGKYLQYLSSL